MARKTSTLQRARVVSFALVPATCPAVNDAFTTLRRAVRTALALPEGERMPTDLFVAFNEAEHCVKRDGTEKLRRAHIREIRRRLLAMEGPNGR
jgi:hypothetical protein